VTGIAEVRKDNSLIICQIQIKIDNAARIDQIKKGLVVCLALTFLAPKRGKDYNVMSCIKLNLN